MAQTLEQILASRKSLYDPQRSLIQQQIDQLPGQETAAVGSADAALKIANDSIVKGANSRGVMYSGAPIDEQNKYAALTYAPAIANIKNGTLANRSKLEAALLGVNQNEADTAQSIQSDQAKADAAAASAAQNRLDLAGLINPAGNNAAPAPASAPVIARNAAGGYAVTQDGKPATIGQYLAAQGYSGAELVKQAAKLLTQSTGGDRGIANAISSGHYTYAQLEHLFPQVFGG